MDYLLYFVRQHPRFDFKQWLLGCLISIYVASGRLARVWLKDAIEKEGEQYKVELVCRINTNLKIESLSRKLPQPPAIMNTNNALLYLECLIRPKIFLKS